MIGSCICVLFICVGMRTLKKVGFNAEKKRKLFELNMAEGFSWWEKFNITFVLEV